MIAQSIISIQNENILNKEQIKNMELKDDNSFDYERYKIAALHLLDIREASKNHWESPSHTPPTEIESSVVTIFEPKFMILYREFIKSTDMKIDLNLHLMSLCLELLLPFSAWVRESDERLEWIREVVDENIDLRPEVRNGLSMLLTYCFASAKASHLKSDMFSVLQDDFGIVNKTSLKIYNDPYNYFYFVKSCLSGLIDAGKIPENERLNQVLYECL